MIIDIHRHIITEEWFSDLFWNGFAQTMMPTLSRMNIPANIMSVISDDFPRFFASDGEKHIELMQEAGIDKATVFAFDVGLFIGEPPIPIEIQNESIFEMAQKYPNHFIPFVHLDPRRPGAIEFARKCFEECDAKGLMLHPGAGFDPSGIETLNLIEAIVDYNVPVITHTGMSMSPVSSKYCDPIYLDDMLLHFPEVNVIAAHMSMGYWRQLFSLGWHRPNLFTDISAWQPTAISNYPEFAYIIRSALDHFGTQRVLFGSDAPFLNGIMPDEKFIQAIKDLPSRAPENLYFTIDEVDAILGGNAAKLLGI